MTRHEQRARAGFLRRLDVHLDQVNELLPGASPIGAYCMGFAFPYLRSESPACWPTRGLLVRLRECATIREGAQMIEAWSNPPEAS